MPESAVAVGTKGPDLVACALKLKTMKAELRGRTVDMAVCARYKEAFLLRTDTELLAALIVSTPDDWVRFAALHAALAHVITDKNFLPAV